jgi:hypothetical protein
MIIVVDFDGTLALGNKSHISILEPNVPLINKLQKLKQEINPIIKIVTARGSKNNLSMQNKISTYFDLIESWLIKYKVPYDEISFNKEYANLYIDDMTINQHAYFEPFTSQFTKNKIIFTNDTIIKETKQALFEHEWYKLACSYLNVPEVLFCNDSIIITERIKKYAKPKAEHFIKIIDILKNIKIEKYSFDTYINNITPIKYSTEKVKNLVYPIHGGTFFHGDLSTDNVLVSDKIYCIDSNYKNIFGSYLTDAGKAFFSLIAYERNYTEANIIRQKYGDDVLKFAVAEGLRVCKYRPEYISIVNNIADLI